MTGGRNQQQKSTKIPGKTNALLVTLGRKNGGEQKASGIQLAKSFEEIIELFQICEMWRLSKALKARIE
jgi:hypothetical protein